MPDGEVEEVVGVYSEPDAPEPCHLIEMVVVSTGWRLAEITQEVEGQPRENWQVPYDANVLSDDGMTVVANESDLPIAGEVPDGKSRLAFFFHYLDLSKPLETPWGRVNLPAVSPRPERLAHIQYEEP